MAELLVVMPDSAAKHAVRERPCPFSTWHDEKSSPVDRRDRIRRETSTARRFAALCGDQWEPLQEQQLPARRSATEPRARGETTIILAVSAHSSPQSSARNAFEEEHSSDRQFDQRMQISARTGVEKAAELVLE